MPGARWPRARLVDGCIECPWHFSRYRPDRRPRHDGARPSTTSRATRSAPPRAAATRSAGRRRRSVAVERSAGRSTDGRGIIDGCRPWSSRIRRSSCSSGRPARASRRSPRACSRPTRSSRPTRCAPSCPVTRPTRRASSCRVPHPVIGPSTRRLGDGRLDRRRRDERRGRRAPTARSNGPHGQGSRRGDRARPRPPTTSWPRTPRDDGSSTPTSSSGTWRRSGDGRRRAAGAEGFDPIVMLRRPIEAAGLIVVRGGPGASA